ncbi:MAG: HupE/UreJ family protein [Betaproteobacteria bacterium]|nr:HupE/UreJ family protein [Betaproteobacteria bacterium]
MIRRPALLTAGAGTALLLASASVQAHLATTGLGPVYDGVAHLFVSFEDLLPALAMALLAGLNGPVAGRLALFMLPLAWFGGGLAGFHGVANGWPAGITSVSLLLLGVLVAADRRLRPPVVAALAAALGLVHGGLNGAALAAAGGEVSGLAGIAAAVFVLVALGSALVLMLHLRWARHVVRVAGSWVAAVGLLLLGWTLSGRI